ncbi:MAG: Protease [Clostridiales bacterium 38_11]|nr:MAG: Protease [Clostridiales bacterium 38_11]
MNDTILLSPAGNRETFIAALKAGADAIYMGGKHFNARYSAENFTDEDLEELIKMAHLADVKVFVTVNTLLKDDEMKDVLRYVNKLYRMKADAIIVQDLGLMKLVGELLPEVVLHASTQMAVNDFYGINLLKRYNIKKNVLARETSIDRIRVIRQKTEADLEAFIHGALCNSYSGQCYISSFFGGRSGNRGRCAQTCRLAFDIIDASTGNKINEKPIYPLSMRELNVGEKIIDLKEAGISTFKIEGRMRKPEYVDRVVRYYRGILDGKTDVKMGKQAEQTFNRGFTEGFVLNAFGKEMMAHENPKNRGIRLGYVRDITGSLAEIALDEDISIGDGVSVGDGEKGFTVDNLMDPKKKEKIKESTGGQRVLINNFHQLRKNEVLYKTSDIKLSNEVAETIRIGEVYKKRAISFEMTIKIGEKINLKAFSGNYSVDFESPEVVTVGRTVQVTEDDIITQLSKLGGTVFELKKTDISIDSGAFVSKSVLNNLRRKAIELISDEILKRDIVNYDIQLKEKPDQSSEEKRLKISLNMTSGHQFYDINFTGLDLLYLPYYLIDDEKADFLRRSNVKIVLSLRNAAKRLECDNAFETYRQYLDVINGVQVDDLDTLEFAKENKMVPIYCDFQLNISNIYAADLLAIEGIHLLTQSVEINLKDMEKINKKTAIETEAILYSRLPLMTIRSCPFSVIKGCNDESNCQNCDVYDRYKLLDRKGYAIDLMRHRGITTLFNPIPLNLIDKVKDLVKSGCDYVRIDEDNTININEMISDIRTAFDDGEYSKQGEVTRGYYHKELL